MSGMSDPIAPRVLETYKPYHDDNVGIQSAGIVLYLSVLCGFTFLKISITYYVNLLMLLSKVVSHTTLLLLLGVSKLGNTSSDPGIKGRSMPKK